MKVTLLEHCASDLAVVNAARVSFAQESELVVTMQDGSEEPISEVYGDDPHLSRRDAGLIKFLMRERHGTPFEHGFFKFRVEAPIFVFREWHRHRVGHSYNEMSGRYVELKDRFYWPEAWRVQKGKPGAYTYEPLPPDAPECYEAKIALHNAYSQAWTSYTRLLELGIAKEQARAVLPLGIYSQMIWSCNPRSLMHFCGLRNTLGAQEEIRDLANQVQEHFEKIMPVTAEAFTISGYKAP